MGNLQGKLYQLENKQANGSKIDANIRSKTFMNNSTPSKLPQLLLLNFLAKFLTEKKYLMNTLIFVRRKYL